MTQQQSTTNDLPAGQPHKGHDEVTKNTASPSGHASQGAMRREDRGEARKALFELLERSAHYAGRGDGRWQFTWSIYPDDIVKIAAPAVGLNVRQDGTFDWEEFKALRRSRTSPKREG